MRTNPDDAASYMGITYWVDVTDYEKIRLEYYASRPIIAVIVIDNYDELIRGLTDRKRNELRDAIEDKLLQWCEGKGGFFRRYDRDRYLYVFEERHLDELRENKFASLLDSVHAVTSPSGIRATVSVGIGRDGDSLDECYNFAILGTEMALSRGGDQASGEKPRHVRILRRPRRRGRAAHEGQVPRHGQRPQPAHSGLVQGLRHGP
ncbi:MAG: hypothetical protein ACLSHG_12590 [Oscillospiraceae bacterium]